MAATVVGSAPGLVLPFLIVARFGADAATDAYFFAYAIAVFASSLCSGVVESNLLAELQHARRCGAAAFATRTRELAVQAVGIVTALYVLAAVAVVGFALLAWPSEGRGLVIQSLAAFVLFIVARAASSSYSAALYCSDDFRRPAATTALRAVFPLAALPFLGGGSEAYLALALLLGAGEVARAVWLGARLRKVVATMEFGDDEVMSQRSVWRPAGLHAVGVAVLNLNPIVDRAVAVGIGAGAVTVLDLADKVFFAPMTILMSSVVVIAGTRWARQVADDAPGLTEDFARRLRSAVLVAVALAAATIAALAVALLIVNADELLDGRAEDFFLVSAIIVLFGLPPAIASLCSARMLIVTGSQRVIPMVAGAGVVVNLIADLIGAHLFGLIGIAIASALTRWVEAGLYLSVVRRQLAARDVAQRSSGAVVAGGFVVPKKVFE